MSRRIPEEPQGQSLVKVLAQVDWTNKCRTILQSSEPRARRRKSLKTNQTTCVTTQQPTVNEL